MKVTVRIEETFYRVEIGDVSEEVAGRIVHHAQNCAQCLAHIRTRPRPGKKND